MKIHKKHLFLITILCLLALTGINACTKDSGETSSVTAVSGGGNASAGVAELLASMNMYYFRNARQAPDFELPSVTGERISLGRYRGKVVLLSFWTTW